MIDVTKWEKMTDEQKLQVCESIFSCATSKAVSKEDYKLMFEFLFEESSRLVQGRFKVKMLYLEPMENLIIQGFVWCRFKRFKVKSIYFIV